MLFDFSMISNDTNSSHLLLYDDSKEMNDTGEDAWSEWAEENCYGDMTESHEATFMQFETIVGGYFNCTFGTLGLIGNVLCIMVLCQKEMRKNCFSQLLIGMTEPK